MRYICRRIVGSNLKGEMALFSLPSTSGGEELRVAVVYIPDVVLKVVDLLEENQRLGVLKAHTPDIQLICFEI